MCCLVLRCVENFINSPSAAIATFHDREHSFDAAQQWTVRRNEEQLYPIDSAKARTQAEISNATLSKGRTWQDLEKKIFKDSVE